MENNADMWLWLGIALGIVLLIGVPLYVIAPTGYLYAALILHAILIGLYVYLLLDFGPNSIVESGFSVFLLSLLFAILLPVYVRMTTPHPKPSHQKTVVKTHH